MRSPVCIRLVLFLAVTLVSAQMFPPTTIDSTSFPSSSIEQPTSVSFPSQEAPIPSETSQQQIPFPSSSQSEASFPTQTGRSQAPFPSSQGPIQTQPTSFPGQQQQQGQVPTQTSTGGRSLPGGSMGDRFFLQGVFGQPINVPLNQPTTIVYPNGLEIFWRSQEQVALSVQPTQLPGAPEGYVQLPNPLAFQARAQGSRTPPSRVVIEFRLTPQMILVGANLDDFSIGIFSEGRWMAVSTEILVSENKILHVPQIGVDGMWGVFARNGFGGGGSVGGVAGQAGMNGARINGGNGQGALGQQPVSSDALSGKMVGGVGSFVAIVLGALLI
ncbi:hypothetical protein HDV05_005639 [Chytridiales sp. JEL 0842]|nr:hypothetical protein HDV05_005639 [Chytridiales sp. JEL 0842]